MAVVQEKKDKVRPVLDFRELNKFVGCNGADADACDEKLRSWRQKSANCALLDLRDAYMQISVADECSNPANNAMQGPCGPCKGCPYGNRTDLAAGAVVAPHGLTARV